MVLSTVPPSLTADYLMVLSTVPPSLTADYQYLKILSTALTANYLMVLSTAPTADYLMVLSTVPPAVASTAGCQGHQETAFTYS